MHSSPLHRNFVLDLSVQFCSFTEHQNGKKRTLISSINDKCWRECRKEGNPPTLLVGMYIGTASVENSTEGPSKLKIELPYNPAIPLLGIYPGKKKKKHNSKRYMRPSVH